MGWVQRLFSIFEDKRELLDVTRFDDPVALRVSWAPLVPGGTNFCTHRARTRSSLSGSQLVFKTSPGAYLFCIGFMSSGVMALGGLLGMVVGLPGAPAAVGLFGLLPLVFLALGGGMLWWLRRKEMCFEQFSGQCTQGTTVHSLHDAHAIQLIREYVRSDKSSYYSYELNLVRRDGSRMNVTDHGSLRAIREDAALLASYLSLPVWDVIDYKIPEAGAAVDSKMDVMGLNLPHP